jgi:hypothetical protein
MPQLLDVTHVFKFIVGSSSAAWFMGRARIETCLFVSKDLMRIKVVGFSPAPGTAPRMEAIALRRVGLGAIRRGGFQH